MKANTSLRLGITYGLFYLAYMSLFPFQTIYLTELGYDKSAISVLTTCTALGNFLIQFPLGRLSAKTHSPRKLLVLLMIGAIPTGFLMYLFHGNLAAVILAVLPVTLLDFSLIGQLDSYTLALQAQDSSVRYSVMRSIGSLTGSAATMVLGSIYASRGTGLMFPLHGSLMALAVLAALLLPKSPPVQTPPTVRRVRSFDRFPAASAGRRAGVFGLAGYFDLSSRPAGGAGRQCGPSGACHVADELQRHARSDALSGFPPEMLPPMAFMYRKRGDGSSLGPDFLDPDAGNAGRISGSGVL